MSKNLGSWQVISLISRFSALFLGLVQSVIIARLLTVSEFGLIGLVSAIGAIAGIAQHLGLASGTTREISASSNKNDAFKIFATSLLIKYVLVFPIAITLFVMAPFLSEVVYKHPELTLPIRLYSIVLVVQGVQSILNSVIAGLQKFRSLFFYQVAIAVLSVIIYVPLVLLYRVNGYFFALCIFNIVGSVSLAFLALWPIREHLKTPSKNEFSRIFKNVFVLSLGIYFVKVLYTIWYKFGQLALGYFNAIESVGIFSFALLYSSKLQTISDALTDVNLPVFSKEFSTNFENFKKLFNENFNKLFIFIMLSGVVGIYWAKDIILLAVGAKYEPSVSLVLPLVMAFAFYSYINILKSSVLIPAKMISEMIMGFVFMLLGTVVSYFVFNPIFGGIVAMSLSMFLGALVGFISLIFMVKFKLDFYIIDKSDILISMCILSIFTGYFLLTGFLLKLIFFLIYSSFLFLVLKTSGFFDLK